VSRHGALPEVCGDAALTCGDGSPEQIARAVESLQREPSLRAALRERGLARAQRFTWEATARALFSVAAELAARP
jgi:glycosyltransferase involved in cell wall biosynthesis